MEFLLARLKGEVARRKDDLIAEAKANLISQATLYRAKTSLGIYAIQDRLLMGDDEYYWKMPLEGNDG